MRMGLTVAALAVAATVASTAPSSATVFFPAGGDLGTYATSGANGFTGGVAKNTPFSDVYTFTLQTFATLSASATNSFLTSTPITNFKLVVGNITGVTLPDASLSSQTASFPPGGQFIKFAPGTYNLTVSGTGGSSFETYGGSFIVNSLSTVPLPSSVGMFGMALAAVGVAGAFRKKSKVVAA